MDFHTCTAAAVTPYPKHIAQAQSRPMPPPIPPPPIPTPLETALSRSAAGPNILPTHALSPRALKETYPSNARGTLTDSHQTLTPATTCPSRITLLSTVAYHANSRQTLTNAHTSHVHAGRPSLITASHPSHTNHSSDRLSSDPHTPASTRSSPQFPRRKGRLNEEKGTPLMEQGALCVRLGPENRAGGQPFRPGGLVPGASGRVGAMHDERRAQLLDLKPDCVPVLNRF